MPKRLTTTGVNDKTGILNWFLCYRQEYACTALSLQEQFKLFFCVKLSQ